MKKGTLVLYHNNYVKNINNLEKNELPKLEKQKNKLNKKKKKDINSKINIKKIDKKIEDIKSKKIDYYSTSFNNLKEYFNCENNNNKDIYEEYLEKVDNNYVSEVKYSENIYFCEKCQLNKKIIKSKSICVCEKCGEFNSILIENDQNMNKNNDLTNNTIYSYKRIGHYLITLNSIKNQVNDNDFNKIKKYIQENKKYKKITESNVKIVLKEMKLYKKYSKNINIIYRKLKRLPVLIIDKNLEDKLIYMFNKTEEVFENHIPSNRKNFFSYPYCIRKFLELLDIDYELLDSLKTLKGVEKLYNQDKIWEKICKELKWEFIPSI
jgi:hypothetical protein